jgi:hypothetical protein
MVDFIQRVDFLLRMQKALTLNRLIDVSMTVLRALAPRQKVPRRRAGTEGTPTRTVVATTIRLKWRLMFRCPWRNVIQVQRP